jgi:Protein of unknown function (DUF3142)
MSGSVDGRPAVADALAKSSDLIRAWHVLVAEADAHGNWSPSKAKCRYFAGGGCAVELMASPTDVAALLGDLRDESPANLVGIVWFRLPTDDDRRAWSIETWRAVMLGKPLRTRVEATIGHSNTSGMNSSY